MLAATQESPRMPVSSVQGYTGLFPFSCLLPFAAKKGKESANGTILPPSYSGVIRSKLTPPKKVLLGDFQPPLNLIKKEFDREGFVDAIKKGRW